MPLGSKLFAELLLLGFAILLLEDADAAGDVL
jgi:hypothetical protein